MKFRNAATFLAVGLAAVVIAAHPAVAQQAAIPPSVKANVERGVAMACQAQWPLALRYFHAAQAEAPDNPAILLNLGLAYDRMSGHEPHAIAWFTFSRSGSSPTSVG